MLSLTCTVGSNVNVKEPLTTETGGVVPDPLPSTKPPSENTKFSVITAARADPARPAANTPANNKARIAVTPVEFAWGTMMLP